MNTAKHYPPLIAILPFISNYASAQSTNAQDYEVAVYYFPNYHVDSINER